MKLCWIINRYGQVCAWHWDTLNCPDNQFLDLFADYELQAIILADWGFRCAQGLPNNVKICKKGTWNDRMAIKTTFSLLTVVAHAKKMYHRAEPILAPMLPILPPCSNTCLTLFHQLDPDQSPFKVSIAEFSF